MWLTDVPMQHRVFAGRPNWNDTYWIHTRVMRLFGDLGRDDTARLRGGVLFRVEPDIGTGRILVQSAEPTVDGSLRSVDLANTLTHLRDNQRVGLRLKINAVKTVNRTIDGKLRQQRENVPLDDLSSWVEGKLQGGLRDFYALDIVAATERQKGTPLFVATVDALATVADASTLASLVASGVGKGKSFGCGLLTLRPVLAS